MRINVFVGLMLASAAILAAQTDPPGRVGRLNYMDGAVSFQPAGLNDWEDASLNRPLTTNDNIWVGDRGRAEFHVGSAALRLSANTAFQFLNLDDRTVQIRLSEGTLTVRLRNLAQDQIFEIDTPNLAFTLVRPGEYRIDANPDSQTTIVTVRDGEGDVTGGGQDFPVYARQRVVVRGDDQITYNLAAVPGPDAWDQWSSSRDVREDRSQSARYVSREVAGYDDLDQYGRWDNQPGYGDVWMPTTVAVGWAPYHDGHWAWIAPWGWTWVDDSPWGFAPFHYGRWASFGGRWGWVPGPVGVTPVYAPALVAWVGGGTSGGFSLSFSIGTAAAVGWFPLGPREPYVPSYQVSQGYFTRVNTTNTVINTTTINNYYNDSRNSNRPVSNISYVNRNVQGSVTAVPQASFARGQRVAQNGRAVTAAQLGSVQVFAAPSIAPQRESVLGARADTSSRAARPPANVTSRPVVARTAPAPASVPFDRQQQALSQNPGRPLPTATVQQIRQSAPAQQAAPVRVVDMGRVKRVQTGGGPGQQGTPQQSTAPPPAGNDQQKGRGRQQPSQSTASPQSIQPPVDDQQRGRGRQQAPAQVVPPQSAQPPVDDQQKGRGRQQQPQPQVAPPQVAQPPADNQQRERGGQPQTVPSSPQNNDQQRGRGRQQPPQQAVPPQSIQPPVDDQQKGRGRQQQPQPQTVPSPPPVSDQSTGRGPQRPQQQAPAQTVQPPVDDQQRGRGRQQPQQQPETPKAPPPPAPAAAPPATPPPPAATPAPAAPKQRQDKGKQSGKEKEDDKQKSDR